MQLKTITSKAAQEGPHLLITGGVHGDEFEPMAALRRLAGPELPPLQRGQLTLVPVVNEPAFLRGHRTGDDVLPGPEDRPVFPAPRKAELLHDLPHQFRSRNGVPIPPGLLHLRYLRLERGMTT